MWTAAEPRAEDRCTVWTMSDAKEEGDPQGGAASTAADAAQGAEAAGPGEGAAGAGEGGDAGASSPPEATAAAAAPPDASAPRAQDGRRAADRGPNPLGLVAGYLGGAWALIEALEWASGRYGVAPVLVDVVLAVAVGGFPLVLLAAIPAPRRRAWVSAVLGLAALGLLAGIAPWDQLRGGGQAAAPTEAGVRVVGTPLPDKSFKLRMKNIELREIAAALSQLAGLKGDAVHVSVAAKKVTLELRGIPLEQSLGVLARNADVAVLVEDGVLQVFPVGRPIAEPAALTDPRLEKVLSVKVKDQALGEVAGLLEKFCGLAGRSVHPSVAGMKVGLNLRGVPASQVLRVLARQTGTSVQVVDDVLEVMPASKS